jgi:hypothetical protein
MAQNLRLAIKAFNRSEADGLHYKPSWPPSLIVNEPGLFEDP